MESRYRVTGDECEQMQSLRNEGHTYTQIADELGRSVSAVRYHCQEDCRHRGGFNRAEVEFLLARLGETIQCIPTMRDWDEWDHSTVKSKQIVRGYGSWPDALRAVGIPVVPTQASRHVREVAYQQPHLTRMDEPGEQAARRR